MEIIFDTVERTLADLARETQDSWHETGLKEVITRGIIEQDENFIFCGITVLINKILCNHISSESLKLQVKKLITMLKGLLIDEERMRAIEYLERLCGIRDSNIEIGEGSSTIRSELTDYVEETDETEEDNMEEGSYDNIIEEIAKKYNIKLEPKILGTGAPAA